MTHFYDVSCTNDTTVEETSDAFLRVLVVNFKALSVASDILCILTSSPRSSDIEVYLVVSLSEAAGSLVCAAYLSSSLITSAEVLLLSLHG
jgi:hypothetical protein